jgi:hypothetical protein
VSSGAALSAEPDVDGGYPGEKALEITGDDSDPGNLLLRAGYMMGLAARALGKDRLFLLRASRSLRAFAKRVEEGGGR